jgi:hypothetical protein
MAQRRKREHAKLETWKSMRSGTEEPMTPNEPEAAERLKALAAAATRAPGLAL